MKSYIKIYGPPVLKAMKALEKIAVDMPEVCIWDAAIELMPVVPYGREGEAGYFGSVARIPEERCGRIISKSGEKVGEYDFYFEWFRNPNQEEVNSLIEKIDNALDTLGCKYTITTK